jgi:hypothetical protein
MTRSPAPTPPGALGERLDPARVQTYLADLEAWVATRRRELDELDAAALASERRAELTGDLTLSMAVWKAVDDRLALLLATWDGGRVGPTERERLSVLIWGRLDAGLDPIALDAATTSGTGPLGGALSVSLPEACRLSDALASQLRVRLALDPAADATTRRLKDLRAQLERLRDQVLLEPSAARPPLTRQVDELTSRTQVVVEKFERGGDVGGLLGPLENDAARLERDLIVGGARRRELVDVVREVSDRRAALMARGAALEALAGQAVAAVDPCPNYAVPEVEALGPVPATEGELAAYRQRLDRVGRAMDVAQEAYAAALRTREDLLARLAAAEVRAQADGVAGLADVERAARLAHEVLERTPAPLPVAAAAVELHEAWARWWGSDSGRRTARRQGLLSGRDSA